jgi:hypothetical protein
MGKFGLVLLLLVAVLAGVGWMMLSRQGPMSTPERQPAPPPVWGPPPTSLADYRGDD